MQGALSEQSVGGFSGFADLFRRQHLKGKNNV